MHAGRVTFPTVPIIIFVILMQRDLIEGLTVEALKSS